jgi:N-acetylneuraminic acid mutarotase
MLSFVVGSKAYVGMGTDQNIFKKDMYCYDPGANNWEAIAPFPAYERAAASTFTLEERGFVCLGNNGGLLSDLMEYNPETNTWTLRAAFGGSERKSAVSFVIDNKAFVGTGKGYSGKKASWYVYEPCNYAALDELEAALQIYPNPFISGVKVKGLNNLVKDVSVYNLAGKKLMTLQLSSYVENEIDLSTLGSGVFIFCFRLEDGQVLTKKLLKS